MNDQLFTELLKLTKSEFNDADVTVIPSDNEEGKSIRVSWSDTKNKKKYQPVIISLHEDFGSSEFSQNPINVICGVFIKFISNKRSQFKPRTTNHTNETHICDYWVFPPEC